MKKLFNSFQKNYNNISVISLFLITALFILYILPREGKFRYEFQRGRPWMHETLIAPFNFPIYKTDAELTAERDSVMADFREYFQYDSQVYDSIILAYYDYFEDRWDSFLMSQYEITEEEIDNFQQRNQNLMSLRDRFVSFSASMFRHVYDRGIIAPGEVADRILNTNQSLVLVRNNVGERIASDGFYRQVSAYEHVTANVNAWINENLDDRPLYLTNFFNSIEFNSFILPNIFYDESMSNRVRQSLMDNISLARGMVQSGERIVSRGELITNDVFQILESLRREYESRLRGANLNMILLGQFIIVISLIITLYLFLFHFRKEILGNIRKTLFILFLLFFMVFMSIMFIRFSMINFYIVPFAIVPIIIRTFYDERLALFVHTIILLLVGFFAPNSFEFVFLNFVIGIVAIFSLTNLYRRSKLFLTAVIIVLSYSFLYFGIAITQERSLEAINWMNFTWFGGNGLLVLTTYPLLYIFEKTFGFISDATLMELSDTNQPLLRKLAEEAPGTFQHSLQVANLAEAAIYEIGGTPCS
jgi:cyclic-di-AMP phosphodiesterase PgpH